MAVLLSTTDGKALTGTQHRALNQVLGVTDDYVVDNYGGKLASTYTGWQITTQTGMAVLNGTLIEVTSNEVNTFDAGGVSGTAMVIAKVNLNTKVATIELKKGTTLVQNNLLASLTGTREVELYRFTHSASAITGFEDKRIIKSNGIDNRVNDLYSAFFPNLPPPAISTSTTNDVAIVATSWGTVVPNGISPLALTFNKPCYVLINIQSKLLINTSDDANCEYDLNMNGATSYVSGSSSFNKFYQYSKNLFNGVNSITRVERINAGLTNFTVHAKKTGGTKIAIDDMKLTVTPIRWE